MKKALVSFLVLITIFSASINAKTLRLALDADPVSMDIQSQLSGGMIQFSHWVFDPLLRYRQDMSFEPRLATKWERINKTSMRFHLRKGVKFHSGNKLTAHDVKWTFERFSKSVDFKGLFEPFEGVVVEDEYTFVVKTKKEYPLLINMMTYVFPMDRKFYTGFDSKGNPKDNIVKVGYSFANETFPSGTGAFKVTKRDHGVELVLEANPNYWDKNRGNVTKVVFRPIKEDATRVAALLSGDVDFISPVPPQDFPRIKKNKNVKLVTHSGGRIIMVQMNQKRHKALANVDVRRAICYAVNNVGISKTIMKGTATPAGQFSPKGYLGHDPKLKPRFNLSLAKKLMKKAGYKKGFSLTMIAPNNRYVNDEKIAEAVVAMLAKINIKVSLKTMPKAQYWGEFDKQVADLQLIGWHSDTEDSGNFYEFLAMTRDGTWGAFNSGNYSNKKVDELTLAAQSETDVAKRTKILRQVEKILYDEAAFIPFHWQNHSYGVAKNVDVYPIVNVLNVPYLGDLKM